MRTSTLSTVMLAGLIGRAPMSSAGPVCHRVASQWTVVFKASCTEWYANGGLERGEPVPDVCSQEFSGDVKVKEFPWNGEVMIVDNENPKSDFTRQQPEQDVAHYRAGIVLVQSSWDVGSDGFWSPRQGTNTESINASVVYVTTEAEEQKFVKFHSLVEYNPSSPAGKNGDRRLEGHTYEGVYDFDGGIDDPEGTSVPLWMGDEQLSTGQEDEEGSEGIYHPDYIYSYDYVSYDFSYSVELSYLDSYMFDVAEDEALTDDSVRSITAVDIYVCVDEENSLAEMRFYCDPDNTGTATCYEKAAGANTRALNIHGFEMFCAKQCLTGELEGLWCDIFGLDGCRMCSTDCSALCDGAGSCLPCVSCPPDNYHPVSGSTPAPAPTDGGSPYPGQPTPAPGNAEPSAQTPSPTPGPTGFEPVLTLAPATDFSGVHSTYTPAPATTAGSMPSPGSMLRGGSETAAPTWAEGRSSTAAPTWAEGRSSTAAPTWEQDMPTAAPTSVGVDVLHFVCTPGDADSCYNELLAIERDVLEDSGRGLTCEESCIVNGGPWCKAYGLGGCRFCHLNCVDFCVDEGLPEGCLCFEC